MDLTAAPHEWWAMALLALMLGARHGFDADHLATVDALTRFNTAANARFARWCGALFSLGHGALVVAVVAAAQWAAGEAQVPGWLDVTGAVISILFLFALGGLNLAAVIRTPPGQMVVPVGLRGRWFAALTRASRPWLVAGVGALFALSFDTLSQATLFAIAGAQLGGGHYPLLLALLFMAGMLVTDGINGLWVARLIRRADGLARTASRLMGLAVALVSFAVGGMGIARFASPAFEQWGEGKELAFGVAVVLTVALAFAAGLALARSEQGTASARGLR